MTKKKKTVIAVGIGVLIWLLWWKNKKQHVELAIPVNGADPIVTDPIVTDPPTVLINPDIDKTIEIAGGNGLNENNYQTFYKFKKVSQTFQNKIMPNGFFAKTISQILFSVGVENGLSVTIYKGTPENRGDSVLTHSLNSTPFVLKKYSIPVNLPIEPDQVYTIEIKQLNGADMRGYRFFEKDPYINGAMYINNGRFSTRDLDFNILGKY